MRRVEQAKVTETKMCCMVFLFVLRASLLWHGRGLMSPPFFSALRVSF